MAQDGSFCPRVKPKNWDSQCFCGEIVQGCEEENPKGVKQNPSCM